MKALLFMLLVSSLSYSAEEADFLMKGKWGIGHLLQWELVRLETLSMDIKLPFAEGSGLFQKIKVSSSEKEITLKSLYKFFESKPKLSEGERHELLGVLRLANVFNRVEMEGGKTAYRTLILDELKNLDPEKSPTIMPPKETEDKIIKEAKEKLDLKIEPGKITLGDLRKIFESPKIKKEIFEEKELASLLGKVRETVAAEKGPEFISDVLEDRALDKLYTEVGKPSKERKLPKGTKIESFFPKAGSPKLGEVEAPKFNIRNPFKLKPQDKGFHAPSRALPSINRTKIGKASPEISPIGQTLPDISEIIGERGDGGVFLDHRKVGDGVGEIKNQKLLEKKDAGKFSLIMAMAFQGEGSSRCQTTVVKKEPVGDKCTYNAATARHCVVHSERPSAELTGLAIQGIGELSNLDVSVDPDGNDFALMTFTARCADVPVVPLRKDRVQDGEEILVETVPGATMVGKAKDAVSGDSLMALDVRSPRNSPFGINPGDSGGGIATVGSDGSLELVGVISSKPTSASLNGIGFFAAKSSMDWANELLSRPLVARNQLLPPDQLRH